VIVCVVKYRSLRGADLSSRGVLPSVVCLECDREASIMRPWPARGCSTTWGRGVVYHVVGERVTVCYFLRNVRVGYAETRYF
jgi:hypothetical protein